MSLRLTTREFMALELLQSMITSPSYWDSSCKGNIHPEMAAKEAVDFAEALINELTNRQVSEVNLVDAKNKPLLVNSSTLAEVKRAIENDSKEDAVKIFVAAGATQASAQAAVDKLSADSEE